MTQNHRAKRRSRSAPSIEARYSTYLLHERGLTSATVHTYGWYVRSFLKHAHVRCEADVSRIERSQIDAFVGATAQRVSLRGVQITVASVRSFLRFAFFTGLSAADLSGAVLSARGWRHAHVPRFLPPASVERLLTSCDDSTPRGRQDRAVLFLLARLGLRPKEIHALRLDDVDWKRGELMVRGKGLRQEWLPLPADVGAALASYLRGSKGRTTRHVFAKPVAGRAEPYTTSWFVNDALRGALKRTGLQAPARWIGASLFRHSLATAMLRHGASLQEIGSVLRHRSAQTTEIYAKVDIEGLRSIARPWPIEVRA